MKQKCFPGNLKIKIFCSTSQIFRKYNHQTDFLYNDGGYVCKIVCQFFGLGSVCYWVCLFLGWWLCLVFGCVFVGWWLGLVFGLCVGGSVWYLVCVLFSWGLGLVLGLCVCGLVSML